MRQTDKPMRQEARKRPKILYAASTQSHLVRFHQPYVDALWESCDVMLMANGQDVDFPVGFEKSLFSPANLGAVLRIRRVLKRERFDGVILNTSLAAFLIRAAMIGMRRRPRVLNIVHGYLFADPPRGLRGAFAAPVRKADSETNGSDRRDERRGSGNYPTPSALPWGGPFDARHGLSDAVRRTGVRTPGISP